MNYGHRLDSLRDLLADVDKDNNHKGQIRISIPASKDDISLDELKKQLDTAIPGIATRFSTDGNSLVMSEKHLKAAGLVEEPDHSAFLEDTDAWEPSDLLGENKGGAAISPEQFKDKDGKRWR